MSYVYSALLAAALVGAVPGLMLVIVEAFYRAHAAHQRGLSRVRGAR